MYNKIVKNYLIKETLGRGSFGVVYKALKQSTILITIDEKKFYVLKQISLAGMDNNQIEEVKQEATILSSLNSDYIVKYYESFMEGSNLNIVMEFCEGGDLSKFLEIQKSKKKYINEDKIWKYFVQICFGLAYIHKKNILHRDLKTLNIFLTKDENVRIGDLGVAKILSAQTQFAKTFVGTPYYLSPEMCEEKPYNEKSDVWALGCILYEMITFKHPFEANNPASLCIKILTTQYEPIPKEYTSDLRIILSLLLEKNYVKRPSIAEILNNPVVLKAAKKNNIDLSSFMSGPNFFSLSDSKGESNFRHSEKIKTKDSIQIKKSVQNLQKKSLGMKKNSPYYNYDFIARKELANQRDRNPKKPSSQARFAKLVGQKPQPVKVVNKDKNEQINKKELNNKLSNEFEYKSENVIKKPQTPSIINNSKVLNNKNDKKRPFTPQNIKVNLNLDKKQESNNVNLIISSHQQLQDTLYFLKNDKSDDTKFFKQIMPAEEYDKIFLNKRSDEIKTIRQLVLHSLKNQDIKEDDYEEVMPDFKSNNLIIIDDKLEHVDILTEFCNNIDSIKSIKENITKNMSIKVAKNIASETNETGKQMEISKSKEHSDYNSSSKYTPTTDVVDEIQEEIDNFKITNFINEDSKFRVNESDSNEEYKNEDSYDSTIENTDIKEIEENQDDEFKEEVKVVVNDNNEAMKEEQNKRMKECIEKIDFFRGKCISVVGEKRFNELYDYYYSLNDQQKSEFISKEKEFTDITFVCYFLQLLHFEHQKKLA